MNKETVLAVIGIFEVFVLILLFGMMVRIFNEVQRDPLDVNRDGEANIVDLSVLAAELNERGK